jgi:hypothetical protein
VVVTVAVAAAAAGLTAGAGLAADPEPTFTVAQAPEPVTAGLQARYDFAIVNGTAGSMFNSQLVDTLPAGATVASVTPSQGTCTVTGATIRCQLGVVRPGASASVRIFLTAPASNFENCGTLNWHVIVGSSTEQRTRTVCDATEVRAANDPNFRGGCVGGNGTISTGTTATPADPQNTALTTPGGECITVAEVNATSPQDACGAGATCKTQISEIEHPPCTASAPCTVILTFDFATYGKIATVYFEGVRVKWCTTPGVASPDPCILKKHLLADGDNQFTLLSAIDARYRGG